MLFAEECLVHYHIFLPERKEKSSRGLRVGPVILNMVLNDEDGYSHHCYFGELKYNFFFFEKENCFFIERES